MQIIKPKDAVEQIKKSLSLDQNNDAGDMLALAILKNASFLLPMTKNAFTKNIQKLFGPLIEVDLIGNKISDCIQDHIVYGNLVEEKNQEGKKELYVSPPSFIESDNKILILGFPKNDQRMFSEDMARKIQTKKHHRYISCANEDEQKLIRNELLNSLLNEIKKNQYKKVPKKFIKEKSVDHLNFIKKQLKPPNGTFDLSYVEKLNTDKSVMNYTRRWDEVNNKTNGEFIIRWGEIYERHYAFAEIEAGHAKKIAMFPFNYNSESDRLKPSDIDQVLYTQMALDDLKGRNQLFQISNINGKTLLSLFHRLSTWIIREFELIANKTEPTEGALMTYELLDSKTTNIRNMLQERWLREQ